MNIRAPLALLAFIGLLLPLASGCSSPPRAAVAIGWDATDSAREGDEAHFQQVQRLLTPRSLGGPVSIVHICSRDGHLLYGAEKPKMAEARKQLEEARKACPCGSSTNCGSDVANGLRVMLDFLDKQSVPRKIAIVHSDLVSDGCTVSGRTYDDCRAVDIPAGVELHVYGVSFARTQKLAAWKKASAGRICLHMTQETIEGSHLGLAPSGVL